MSTSRGAGGSSSRRPRTNDEGSAPQSVAGTPHGRIKSADRPAAYAVAHYRRRVVELSKLALRAFDAGDIDGFYALDGWAIWLESAADAEEREHAGWSTA